MGKRHDDPAYRRELKRPAWSSYVLLKGATPPWEGRASGSELEKRFVEYLERQGWRVEEQPRFELRRPDVVARKGSEVLVAEVKSGIHRIPLDAVLHRLHSFGIPATVYALALPHGTEVVGHELPLKNGLHVFDANPDGGFEERAIKWKPQAGFFDSFGGETRHSEGDERR